MSAIDVLIVGAGPTGLMMACQLVNYNISFRIIDKTEDHTTQSRALVIQARSVEILEQLGIAEKAIQRGRIARAIGAFFNGKKVLRVKVTDMGAGLTKFPQLLMLEQSQTEKILIEYLEQHGRKVERNTELINLNQVTDKVVGVLKLKNENEESITAKYVVGADGAHSIVRENLNISFGGKTYSQSLFVLDCKAEVDIPSDEMYLAFSDKAFGGFFPLTNGRWRILGSIPEELAGKGEINFQDIETSFGNKVKINVRLFDPQWISVYHSHHRYAASFSKDRCFLVGDAAHIHSPVGAQGMNTGLQDAYNLAWKLALVIKGIAENSLLYTYNDERISIAKKLVRSTDRIFNVVTSSNAFTQKFRLYVVPFFLRIAGPIFQNWKYAQKTAFKLVSEIGINYRYSSLSRNASLGKFPHRAPKPGDRLPFIQFEELDKGLVSIQDKTKGKFFTLFIFSHDVPADLFNTIAVFKDFISIELIQPNNETRILYKEFGIETSGYYLVRPDMYIAYRANRMDTDHFRTYLSQFLRR